MNDIETVQSQEPTVAQPTNGATKAKSATYYLGSGWVNTKADDSKYLKMSLNVAELAWVLDQAQRHGMHDVYISAFPNTKTNGENSPTHRVVVFKNTIDGTEGKPQANGGASL